MCNISHKQSKNQAITELIPAAKNGTARNMTVSVTARNGEDALQKARQQSFDLVVTDIRMPGTDGLQALEEVKARTGYDIKVAANFHIVDVPTAEEVKILREQLDVTGDFTGWKKLLA